MGTLCWLYIAAPPPDRECEDGYGQYGGGGCGQAVVSRPAHCEINGSSLLSFLYSIACKHSAAYHHFERNGVAFWFSIKLMHIVTLYKEEYCNLIESKMTLFYIINE